MRPDASPEDTGRNAYREPGDAPDGRDLVISRRPFWSSPSEELVWLHAVEECRHLRPMSLGDGQIPTVYLQRIIATAGAKMGQAPEKRVMPRRPWKDQDEVLMELRRQVEITAERAEVKA